VTDALVRSESLMGTVVTIHVVGHGATAAERDERALAIERAFGWFREVERCCSRFDDGSEVRALMARAGEAVQVSETLFQTVQFALALAEETDGAFDPAVGRRMEELGYNRHYRTGKLVSTGAVSGATWREVEVDPAQRTITLHRAIILDLGAVAKGLAVDLAARELAEFADFAVDAGGDLYLGGTNAGGEQWSVGIRHPRQPGAVIETLRVSNVAVCTSGDYERREASTESHIVNGRTGRSARELASVTVITASAMVADALGTAAFILGPQRGMALLERHGVRGVLITHELDRLETAA
jgi:thiamine biosynthesis lipoprotein